MKYEFKGNGVLALDSQDGRLQEIGHIKWGLDTKKRMLSIDDLWVDQEHRRKGIATELVKRCIFFAKKAKLHHIVAIVNPDIIPLLKKLGFKCDMLVCKLDL